MYLSILQCTCQKTTQIHKLSIYLPQPQYPYPYKIKINKLKLIRKKKKTYLVTWAFFSFSCIWAKIGPPPHRVHLLQPQTSSDPCNESISFGVNVWAGAEHGFWWLSTLQWRPVSFQTFHGWWWNCWIRIIPVVQIRGATAWAVVAFDPHKVPVHHKFHLRHSKRRQWRRWGYPNQWRLAATVILIISVDEAAHLNWQWRLLGRHHGPHLGLGFR